MFVSRLLVLLLSPLALAAGATAGANDHPLPIDAEVTVAADGSVSAASILRPQLPSPIEAAALATIRDLRFRPIAVEGQPAAVTTQLSFSACVNGDAAEQDLRLAMQLAQIGPQPIERKPPPLPRALVFDRSHTELLLDFVVNADGSASFSEMNSDASHVRGRARSQVEREYQRWIESLRFSPERVNGQPVATRMEWPITITVSRSERPLPPPTPAANPACALAKQPAQDAPRVAEQSARVQLLLTDAG